MQTDVVTMEISAHKVKSKTAMWPDAPLLHMYLRDCKSAPHIYRASHSHQDVNHLNRLSVWIQTMTPDEQVHGKGRKSQGSLEIETRHQHAQGFHRLSSPQTFEIEPSIENFFGAPSELS